MRWPMYGNERRENGPSIPAEFLPRGLIFLPNRALIDEHRLAPLVRRKRVYEIPDAIGCLATMGDWVAAKEIG